MLSMPWPRLSRFVSFEKASNYDTEEVARLLDEQKGATRKIRNTFLAAIDKLAASVDITGIINALRAGDLTGAIAALEQATVAQSMASVGASVTGVVISAGQAAARLVTKPDAVEFVFGVTNPKTVTYLQNYEYNLIREMTAETQRAVGAVVMDGVKNGTNPIDIARNVRGLIGLTTRQSQAVLNYRRALENREANALTRALRDKRFDATVARALQNNTPLSKEQIDKMVNRYRDRWLKYRAETIARTEAMRGVNSGGMLAWQQAIDDGKVTAAQVVRFWVFTHDDRTRPNHRRIPGMNEKGVAWGEPYKTPDGPLMYPGDPAGTPENTINCRCTQIIRFKYARRQASVEAPPEEPYTPTPEEKAKESRVAAAKYVLDKGRATNVEHLQGIDLATGEIMEEVSSGDVGFVGVPPRMLEAFGDKNRSIEVHHNHPSGHSFSVQDIRMVEHYPGLTRLFAHGHPGGRYEVSDVKPGAAALMHETRERLGTNAAWDIARKFPPEAAGRVMTHVISETVARANLMKYSAKLAPEVQAAIDGNREAFDEMLRFAASRRNTILKSEPQAPAMFIDPPGSHDPLPVWEQYLASLERQAKTTKGLEPFIAEAKVSIAAKRAQEPSRA